jgi:exosome complex exonuclease DIS3/RRP44
MNKEKSKINQKGQVIKIVNEHYLRDNISCNSSNCNKCEENNKILEKQNNQKFSTIKEIKNGTYYIILGSKLLVDYLEIILKRNKNVIICETTLNEIKNENIKEYKRLRQMITNKEICLFLNEHSIETYFEKEESEKVEKYNFELIVKAAEWYYDHLDKKIPILIINDDFLYDLKFDNN